MQVGSGIDSCSIDLANQLCDISRLSGWATRDGVVYSTFYFLILGYHLWLPGGNSGKVHQRARLSLTTGYHILPGTS